MHLGGSAAYRLLGARSHSGLVHYGLVVSGRLSRSGLPTSHGWRTLRQMGIRTIVNLRLGGDDIRLLRSLGFRGYLHLPVPDGLPLSKAQANAFLDFVTDPSHWPVHLHCLTGVQRSGAAVALVRYAVEGVALSVALHEPDTYFPGPTRIQIASLTRWARQHPPGERAWRHPSSTRLV